MRTKRKQKNINKSNIELDLHGTKHNEVKNKIDDFVNTHYDFINEYPELIIITGNSEKMKSIAKEILTEYSFQIIENGPRLTIY